jgi:hypothetical protein
MERRQARAVGEVVVIDVLIVVEVVIGIGMKSEWADEMYVYRVFPLA